MGDILVMILSFTGAAFILMAAIGILRMPDFFLRLSVTTKAATLGIGLMLIGGAVYFSEISVTSRVLAIIFFLLLTAPVAAHMIGRTSYFIGTKLWKKTVIDELKGKYDPETSVLRSGDQKEKNQMEKKKEDPT